MKSIFSIAPIALLPFVFACSSSTTTDPNDSDPTSTTTTTTTGGSVGTAGGGTQGGGGSAPSGDVVTLKMTEFNVPAGAEVYKCQNFANPFGGDGQVSEFASHMALGSHHLLLFYKEGATNDAIEDCSGLEFAATPYSTQLPDDSLTFPEGVAALIPAGYGIRLQSHYLNTTGDDITAKVEVDFTMAKPETVKANAGVLFMIDTNIHVPPHGSQVVARDCAIPFDMNILKASSHMHKHGVDFQSTVAGKSFFNTNQWSDPKPDYFSPAIPEVSGAPIHYQCTFQNDGDTALTFGESAQTNEMCILVASFYPIASPDQVTVDCSDSAVH